MKTAHDNIKEKLEKYEQMETFVKEISESLGDKTDLTFWELSVKLQCEKLLNTK